LGFSRVFAAFALMAAALSTHLSALGADGEKCSFATDCAEGFLCLIPPGSPDATSASRVCMDPSARFLQKFESAYDLSANGSHVLVNRTFFIIPYMKQGPVTNESIANVTIIKILIQNQGPFPINGFEYREPIPKNVSSRLEQPVQCSPRSRNQQSFSEIIWNVSLNKSDEFISRCTIGTGISADEAQSFQPPAMVSPPTPFVLPSIPGPGNEALLGAFTAIILLLALFLPVKSPGSDHALRAKISKLKGSLWQNPSEWERTAAKAKRM